MIEVDFTYTAGIAGTAIMVKGQKYTVGERRAAARDETDDYLAIRNAPAAVRGLVFGQVRLWNYLRGMADAMISPR